MRSLLFLPLSLGLVTLTTLSSADAPVRDKSNSQFSLRQGDVAGGAGETARGKARAGDCAGALEYFDRAIDVFADPMLRRDRGICHDKLNHPFPAIEDFRAYLSARPDAPDADQIRGRLGTLEGANGIPKEDNKGESEKAMETPTQRAALETMITDERLADAAETSSLRNATGGVLGAYAGVRTFFGGGVQSVFQNVDGSTLGYQVGIAGRFSAGRYFDFLGELGLVGYGDAGDNQGIGGPGFYLAGQFKLPVTKNSGDMILIGLGPGYERYSANHLATSSTILGIGRLGFRHVFGPNFGIEFHLYGGLAHVTFVDVPLGSDLPDVNRGIFGLQIDALVGF